MPYVFYNLLLYLSFPVLAVMLAWRLFTRPEYREAVDERFGRIAPFAEGGPVLWLHAVSVGEMISAVPLVKALGTQYPEARIVVSCGTPTGRATASERLAGHVSRVIYLPYDFAPFVRRAVSAMRPAVFILMETEIWPNLLHELACRKVPVLLANGRISRRSYPRYRLARPLIRQALDGVLWFLVQSRRDAHFIRRIGAAPERVVVTGNIKYDQPLSLPSAERLTAYRQALGIPPGALVLLAGSTHDDEEVRLARIWQRLAEHTPELVLLIAPRHPQRAGQVTAALKEMGIEAGRKSLNDCAGKPVILLDSLGELAAHYPLAAVAFVGGSLVPVGGHNPLEPAAMGVPVVYGPQVSNFHEPCLTLERAGAAIRVSGDEALEDVLARLMADGELRRRMGAAGEKTVADNRGALAATLGHIGKVLDACAAKR